MISVFQVMCVMNGNEENVKIAPGLPYDSKNMANLIRFNYTVFFFFFSFLQILQAN